MATAVRGIAARVSARAAVAWRRRIETAIVALESAADQWPEADEAAELGMDLRCRLVGRRPHVYRIIFTIDGDDVFVYRVLHAARDRLTADDI
jgi:plasmid stabilization system protein ParE